MRVPTLGSGPTFTLHGLGASGDVNWQGDPGSSGLDLAMSQYRVDSSPLGPTHDYSALTPDEASKVSAALVPQYQQWQTNMANFAANQSAQQAKQQAAADRLNTAYVAANPGTLVTNPCFPDVQRNNGGVVTDAMGNPIIGVSCAFSTGGRQWYGVDPTPNWTPAPKPQTMTSAPSQIPALTPNSQSPAVINYTTTPSPTPQGTGTNATGHTPAAGSFADTINSLFSNGSGSGAGDSSNSNVLLYGGIAAVGLLVFMTMGKN